MLSSSFSMQVQCKPLNVIIVNVIILLMWSINQIIQSQFEILTVNQPKSLFVYVIIWLMSQSDTHIAAPTVMVYKRQVKVV